MDLFHWQQRFETWLTEHHAQGDAAHDISHFRRVWATAQRLAEDTDTDRLVILTACYFHDVVSLAKNHPERSRSSAMAAEKTLAILQSAFPDFPAERYAAVLHAIEADHFQCKLLRLPQTMQTEKGRAMAIHNARFLVQFMAKLSAELRGDPMAIDDEVLQRFNPLA